MKHPRVLTKTIQLMVPPKGASRVYLVFNLPRSAVLRPGSPILEWELPDSESVELYPLPEGYTWAKDHNLFDERSATQFPHVLVLDIGPEASRNDLEYQVLSLGEKPELVRYVYMLETGSVVQDSKSRACYDTTDVQRTSSRASAHALVFDIGDYLAALKQAISKLPDEPPTRYRKFFAELDRLTDGNLRKSGNGHTDPDWLEQDILDGTRQGVELRFQNEYVQFISQQNCGENSLDEYSDYVTEVSKLILKLMRRHMSGGFHGFDLIEVADAFELFANGQLRLSVSNPKMKIWTTQPSSGFYFYFGQFALLAAEVGPQDSRAAWIELAKVMVRTQAVFQASYSPSQRPDLNPCEAPDKKRWDLEHYCACNFDVPSYDPGALEQLRLDYDGLDLAGLSHHAAQNAHSTFPGLLARLVPC